MSKAFIDETAMKMWQREDEKRKVEEARARDLAIDNLVYVANDRFSHDNTPAPATVRVEAVLSLGKYMPNRKAAEALSRILRDKVQPEEVRRAAARALSGTEG